jgi:hypothetical protein
MEQDSLCGGVEKMTLFQQRIDFTSNGLQIIADSLYDSTLLKPLFHSSQKPTRKLAARTYIQSQYLKALAASWLL